MVLIEFFVALSYSITLMRMPLDFFICCAIPIKGGQRFVSYRFPIMHLLIYSESMRI